MLNLQIYESMSPLCEQWTRERCLLNSAGDDYLNWIITTEASMVFVSICVRRSVKPVLTSPSLLIWNSGCKYTRPLSMGIIGSMCLWWWWRGGGVISIIFFLDAASNALLWQERELLGWMGGNRYWSLWWFPYTLSSQLDPWFLSKTGY